MRWGTQAENIEDMMRHGTHHSQSGKRKEIDGPYVVIEPEIETAAGHPATVWAITQQQESAA